MATKNDTAWKKLFEEHAIIDNISSNGIYEITSDTINKLRESRLMTKIDHKSNLPEIFRANNLSILPTQRGSYIIGSFNAYNDVTYIENEVTNISLPNEFESIDVNNIYSEASALLCAYVSGIIDDVAEQQVKFTVSGRMSTGLFNYDIQSWDKSKTYNISVNNSQCEIDAGFETEDKLIIIEAKNTKVEDFITRQLFYPYKLWSGKVNKEVIPVFMTYSNDIFSFFVYKFENANNYNSLKLIKQLNYSIFQEEINLEDIKRVVNKAKTVEEPNVPFPQADTFERVIDLLGLLMENDLTDEEITINYEFTSRQTQYYTRAGIYLGLVDKNKATKKYYLTSDAVNIMKMSYRQKYLAIAERIIGHKVFNLTLREYLKNGSRPEITTVCEIMRTCGLYNINSDNTFARRAQTVIAWVEWILNLNNS